MEIKVKNIFVEGPIFPSRIAESIGHHQSKTKIGAHNIFLGQVRADNIEGKEVSAIEYTAQKEIANSVCHEIREAAFSKYNLSCMHIYHSLGVVKKGELCFFVFVSSAHRGPVFESLSEIVSSN
ncbi:MAG: molybdenum cofactor biosynthesis protein MoaE, partial [Flavobacteriaceae bacterium]|nr:molybdenum cofactor biosynthesis protein MoaE [Flavobacteriaceae bacterium]